MTPPVLETERLILRRPEAKDFERWASFHCDAQSMRYLGGAMTRGDAWRALAQVVGMWPLRGFGQFSIIEKATGEWIGRVGPWFPEGWPGLEVGWMLLHEARGKGYAQEAATATLDFAFEVLGWDDVIHVIHPDNLASQKLAQRMGSARLGPVRMPPPMDQRPAESWGQTREAWRSRVRR